MASSVLIVDDSLTVRMDLGECFQSAGFEVHLSSTLGEARQILTQTRIDGIVLDVILPDGDGTEFLEEIGTLSQTNPPVLLLTSETQAKSRMRGLRAGAHEYVGKPYDRNYVVVRLDELIGANRQSRGKDSILLIDDSLTVREELGELLREAGYHVLTAPNGEEGLLSLVLHRPSLVVVDSVMPGINGAEVIRRIRLDSALRGTPCLMLTGSESEHAEQHALDAGADAFLQKDTVAPLILARIRSMLRSAGTPLMPQTKALGSSRVLVVDGDREFLESMLESMAGEGFGLLLAATEKEAMDLLEAQTVDCILLGRGPELHGEATCRHIKSEETFKDVPLLLLTESHDPNSILSGLLCGADDCVPKSTNQEVLKARVRSYLRRRQLQEEKRRSVDEQLERELKSAEAKASKELARARAELISKLEAKNRELERAYEEVQATQVQLVHTAKMASLGQLVAGLAHEINNPIAYVSGNLESVARWLSQLSPQAEKAFEHDAFQKWLRVQTRIESAVQGVERVAELVRKLRTFSRLDEGEFKSVDIPETIESVLCFLEHRLNEKIEVRRRYQPNLPRLACYPSALNQVIMNLLVNAVDSIESQSETGVIIIGTDTDDEWFRITVTDSGPGLTPGIEERLFEPFFTTKPVGKGTGLGLSISFGIIQSHQGRISAKNIVRGGCEFTLEIPRDLEKRIQAKNLSNTELY